MGPDGSKERRIKRLKVANFFASQALKRKNKNIDIHPDEALKGSLERLEGELERIKRKTCIGFEVKVKRLHGRVELRNGRQLEDEVVGNTIFIYVEDVDRAIELVSHGYVEWILNQHSKPYRQMINKLIELFEEQQYEEKERIADAITKLLKPDA